jgi:hypothetical protein
MLLWQGFQRSPGIQRLCGDPNTDPISRGKHAMLLWQRFQRSPGPAPLLAVLKSWDTPIAPGRTLGTPLCPSTFERARARGPFPCAEKGGLQTPRPGRGLQTPRRQTYARFPRMVASSRPRAGRGAAVPGGLVPVPARGGALQWPEASCPLDRENKCGAAWHPWSRVGPESESGRRISQLGPKRNVCVE